VHGSWLAQNNKRVYPVVGAESTGTRLMCDLLIEAGCQCNHSDDWQWQQWDNEVPHGQPLTYHRSFPHGGQWHSMSDLFNCFKSYQLFTVVMVRDWYSIACSQSRFQKVNTITPNIQRAYINIFEGLKEHNYEIVPYEALRSEDYVRAFLERLGLDHHCRLPVIRDENEKYYAL